MDAMTILIIGRLIVAGICFAGAAAVALNGSDGWGWLIFAGIIIGSITVSTVSPAAET